MGGSLKEVSIKKNCYILADPKGRLNLYTKMDVTYGIKTGECVYRLVWAKLKTIASSAILDL
jgi:hypothetical protein